MIEIKSRYDDRVLYTAQNATDVRTALEEAAKADANLARANLADANLADANLADANLVDANLADANLADANLADANLADANLARANLARANLADANLADANLAGANLVDANLAGAYLARANLAGANLVDAKNFNPARVNHLSLLAFQTGKIRAFKLVDEKLRSPIQSSDKITYEIGGTVKCPNADTNATRACAAGINVATAPWILTQYRTDHRILLVEFTAKDLAAVPVGDGKFRLHQCKVIREVEPSELGIDADGRDLETPDEA